MEKEKTGASELWKSFLDYGTPFVGYGEKDHGRPPVWISVVGERGAYPLAFRPQPDDDYLSTSPAVNSREDPEHTRSPFWVSLYWLATVVSALIAIDSCIFVYYSTGKAVARREKTPIWRIAIDRVDSADKIHNRPYLIVALWISLFAYLVVAFPLVNYPTSPLFYLATTIIVAQFVAMFAIVFLVPAGNRLFGMLSFFAVYLTLNLLIAAIGVLLSLDPALVFLAAERTLVVSSGVSPIFSTLFLAGTFGLWVASRIKTEKIARDYPFYTPRSVVVPEVPRPRSITDFYESVYGIVANERCSLDVRLRNSLTLDVRDATGLIISSIVIVGFAWLTCLFMRSMDVRMRSLRHDV